VPVDVAAQGAAEQGEGVLFGVGFAAAADGAIEGGGGGRADAAEAPGGGDDALDQEDLGGGGGLVFVEQGLAELFEGGLVFDGEDQLLGGEAVGEGVEGGAGFAFGGLGSGGAEGVEAVGGDLTFGSHGRNGSPD
jgi:hypothetical protein